MGVSTQTTEILYLQCALLGWKTLSPENPDLAGVC